MDDERKRMTAPIRMIARDLYRLRRKVEELEERLSVVAGDQKASIEDQIRKTKAERNRMKSILDGNKEPPPCRSPR